MDPTRKRPPPLWEVYHKLMMTAARSHNPRLLAPSRMWKMLMQPPTMLARWTPWRLWAYTGYSQLKLSNLGNHYVNPDELELTVTRVGERVERAEPCCLMLRAGFDNTHEKLERNTKQVTHSMGDCFTAFMLDMYPVSKTEWVIIPLVTWRASEMIRRLPADFVMVDNLLHDILDPYELYESIAYVVLNFGAIRFSAMHACLAEYWLPGITKAIPNGTIFRDNWEKKLALQRACVGKTPDTFARYPKYKPIQRAIQATEKLAKRGLPPMFPSPLRSSHLHNGARESDFPRYSYRRGARKERRRSRKTVSRKGRRATGSGD